MKILVHPAFASMRPSSPAQLSMVRQEVVPTQITRPPAALVRLMRSAVSRGMTQYSLCIWWSVISSSLTGRKVRSDVAMTGEVTLRGRVLAIGGLREKTMAALRCGISTVIIPADNVKDLEEIDQAVRAALTFVPVKQVDEVLAHALAAGLDSEQAVQAQQFLSSSRTIAPDNILRQ